MTQNGINTKSNVVQWVYNVFTNAVTINAAIPKDNTIPQNTEGIEIATLSITPTNSSNILVIKAMVWAQAQDACDLAIALFQDATANALAATEANFGSAAGWVNLGTIFYAMTAGTTSATTFKIRGGENGATTTIVNAALFGGVQCSYMEIMEIKP